jgi:acetyltransferase-like isoleucine patch superfamily enzyme
MSKISTIIKRFRNKRKSFARGEGNTLIIADYKNVIVKIKGSGNYVEVKNLKKFCSGVLKIKIAGENCKVVVDEGVYVSSSVAITVGQAHSGQNYVKGVNVSIGKNTSFELAEIMAFNSGTNVSIGDNCMFAQNVLIYNTDGHPVFDASTKQIINRVGDLSVGSGSWLCRNAVVLKNVKLAQNTIVALGAIVSKSVEEPNTVVAGNPAKIVKRNVNWAVRDNGDYCNNNYLKV